MPLADVEKRRDYNRDLRIKNIEKRRAYLRDWRAKNAEKYKDQMLRDRPNAAARVKTTRVKAKLFDTLLPILQSGDAKALEKMRRQLARAAKSL